MSQNEIKAQKWFSKSHAPAHQARATAGKASLQARADFQQQDCVGEDSLCLLQHLNSSCNCNKQKRQLHCLVWLGRLKVQAAREPPGNSRCIQSKWLTPAKAADEARVPRSIWQLELHNAQVEALKGSSYCSGRSWQGTTSGDSNTANASCKSSQRYSEPYHSKVSVFDSLVATWVSVGSANMHIMQHTAEHSKLWLARLAYIHSVQLVAESYALLIALSITWHRLLASLWCPIWMMLDAEWI